MCNVFMHEALGVGGESEGLPQSTGCHIYGAKAGVNPAGEIVNVVLAWEGDIMVSQV